VAAPKCFPDYDRRGGNEETFAVSGRGGSIPAAVLFFLSIGLGKEKKRGHITHYPFVKEYFLTVLCAARRNKKRVHSLPFTRLVYERTVHVKVKTLAKKEG